LNLSLGLCVVPFSSPYTKGNYDLNSTSILLITCTTLSTEFKSYLLSLNWTSLPRSQIQHSLILTASIFFKHPWNSLNQSFIFSFSPLSFFQAYLFLNLDLDQCLLFYSIQCSLLPRNFSTASKITTKFILNHVILLLKIFKHLSILSPRKWNHYILRLFIIWYKTTSSDIR
jgi:hypothetical protein